MKSRKDLLQAIERFLAVVPPENQAIDRTHRIGQTSKVMAYRLLARDSSEQKIRILQKQKAALTADVLGDERFGQSLTLEDLRLLFAE